MKTLQVMQNKSEKYSRMYRRCPKVSVAELREAMGGPLNAHRATASLARAAPTGGRCARPASSRCTTRPQTRSRTPLAASGSRWLDEQHPLGRRLGPAAAVAAVGLRDSRRPPVRGGTLKMDAESAKRVSRFCDPAAWFDKRHRSRVGELTILFSSLGLATAISTRRSGSEATRPGSGLSVGYMPLAAAPRSTKRSRFTLPPSDDRCAASCAHRQESNGGRWRRAATLLTQWKVAHIPTLTTTP